MKIDLDALVVAFNDNSMERSYYLDRETGKIFSLLEDHNDTETEEITWQIEADRGRRYIQVPKLSMEETMQEQDDFLESLDDSELKNKLTTLLESDPDGSRFEKFIKRSREARDKWQAFVKVRSRKRADEWMKSQSFTAT